METNLDLHDIQGNIVRGYGKYGFPKARYLLYEVIDEAEARQWLGFLAPLITTAAPWKTRPEVTTNVAFTYGGLKKLGLPRKSLQSFPEEFVMGMQARSAILGDNLVSSPKNWDPVWQKSVDILVTVNGPNTKAVEDRFVQLCQITKECPGVQLLKGHRGDGDEDNLPYQDASAIFEDGKPSPKEHFGYTDGISDPYFKGSGSNPANVIGGGKPTRGNPATPDGWQPLETGEFLLGHRDEAFEYPKAPVPRLLSFNGTFMVFRKLHENVGSFNRYIRDMGKDFPGGPQRLAAKFVGRWKNGAPLALFPSEQQATEFGSQVAQVLQRMREGDERQKQQARQEYAALRGRLTGFNYNEDISGGRCPLSAHIRRANPRGSLEFGEQAFKTPGALVNRRRILRRGLPYGKVLDPEKDDGNHGIIFMAINASIERQFEFVQQQWINYGNDFKQANDKDPILGNHGLDKNGRADGRMIIENDPQGDQPPFFCSRIPRFVETRGGQYFFIPSLTALRMIAEGIIDPT